MFILLLKYIKTPFGSIIISFKSTSFTILQNIQAKSTNKIDIIYNRALQGWKDYRGYR